MKSSIANIFLLVLLLITLLVSPSLSYSDILCPHCQYENADANKLCINCAQDITQKKEKSSPFFSEKNRVRIYLFLIIVLVILLQFLRKRRQDIPDENMKRLIRQYIFHIQKIAMDNIMLADDTIDQGIMTDIDKQTIEVNEIIRFIYTVEQDHYAFKHTLSSQLIPSQAGASKTRKYQENCMVCAINFFVSQLFACGFEHEDIPTYDDESKKGTFYIGFDLDVDQQTIFEERILEKTVAKDKKESKEIFTDRRNKDNRLQDPPGRFFSDN